MRGQIQEFEPLLQLPTRLWEATTILPSDVIWTLTWSSVSQWDCKRLLAKSSTILFDGTTKKTQPKY